MLDVYWGPDYTSAPNQHYQSNILLIKYFLGRPRSQVTVENNEVFRTNVKEN